MISIRLFRKEAGFTLIELLVVIAIIGIVYTALYNFNLVSWNFYEINRDTVDLEQQSLVILTSLTNNIRRAYAVRTTADTDEDGNNELILDIGDTGSGAGEKDYLMYQVENMKMTVKKATSTDWPTDEQWVTNNVLTGAVITGSAFTYYTDTTLVEFQIGMTNDKADRELAGQVFPRVY